MENLLEGAYDLHIHCGPDVVARSVTGLEMARRAQACGMRGFAIKAHYDATCQQAAMVRTLVPGCNAVGTLTLNSTVGGINPMAVENAARLGAGIVWCPTFDSSSQQTYYLEHYPQYIAMQKKLLEQNIPVPSYRIIDEAGKLLPEMSDVLELVQAYDLTLGTGHITHEETFALAREAARRNYKKLLITHADWSFTHYSLEEQEALVRLGATIEHSYTSLAEGAVEWEAVFHEIRKIGVQHVVITTDLGQAKNEYPDIGLQKYAERLREAGFSRDDLRRMLTENPGFLVEK